MHGTENLGRAVEGTRIWRRMLANWLLDRKMQLIQNL